MSDTDPDEEYPSTKLVDMVRSCIKHVLGYDTVEYEVPFVTFRERLKSEVVNASHPVYSQLMSSPYFYKKTITKTLLNLAKTLQDSAEREMFCKYWLYNSWNLAAYPLMTVGQSDVLTPKQIAMETSIYRSR